MLAFPITIIPLPVSKRWIRKDVVWYNHLVAGFPHTTCEAGFQARAHMPACWDGTVGELAREVVLILILLILLRRTSTLPITPLTSPSWTDSTTVLAPLLTQSTWWNSSTKSPGTSKTSLANGKNQTDGHSSGPPATQPVSPSTPTSSMDGISPYYRMLSISVIILMMELGMVSRKIASSWLSYLERRLHSVRASRSLARRLVGLWMLFPGKFSSQFRDGTRNADCVHRCNPIQAGPADATIYSDSNCPRH